MKKFVCDMGSILAALGAMMVLGGMIEGTLSSLLAILLLALLGFSAIRLHRLGSGSPAPRARRRKSAPGLRVAKTTKRGLRVA